MTTTTDITYLCGCEASGDNVSPFCPMHGKPIAKGNTTMTTTAEKEWDKLLTKALISVGQKAEEGYFNYAAVVARRLPKHLHEQLNQLLNGPVWDGDVISKSIRDELFDYKLAIRVCVNGEQGYTGATYFVYSVMKIIQEIKTGKRG